MIITFDSVSTTDEETMANAGPSQNPFLGNEATENGNNNHPEYEMLRNTLTHRPHNRLVNKRSNDSNHSQRDYNRMVSFEQQQQRSIGGRIVVPKAPEGYTNLAYDIETEQGAEFYPDDDGGPLYISENTVFQSSQQQPPRAPHNSVHRMFDGFDSRAPVGPTSSNNVEQSDPLLDADPTQPPPPVDRSSRLWNLFVTLPPPDEDETRNSPWVEISIKWLKVFAYIFTFLVVLTFAVLSKSLTLLMTSMVQPDRSIAICNNDPSYIIHPPLDHDKQYTVEYLAKGVERISWLWCLYFATVAPYVFTFFRSVRICYFKAYAGFTFKTFATVLVLESCHVVGLSMLLFVVLPTLDVTKGAMMLNSVGVVPCIIRVFTNRSASKNFIADHLMVYLNFLLQLITIAVWTLVGFNEKSNRAYLIPVALVLVSFEWWENYLIPGQIYRWLRFLETARTDLQKSRYFLQCFMSIWKILLVGGFMFINEYVTQGKEMPRMMFANFTDGFGARTIPVIRNKENYENNMLLDGEKHNLYVEDTLVPVWILIVHICATYTCYAFAKFTCKVCIQKISFAIPVTMAVPFTVSFLWAISNVAFEDKCKLNKSFNPFQYIFWYTNQTNTFSYFEDDWLMNWIISVTWFFALFNQISNTWHIWHMTSERLASTEQIFLNPMYNAMLIDQGLAFNRRRIKVTFNADCEECDDTDVEKAEIQFKERARDENHNDVESRKPKMNNTRRLTGQQLGQQKIEEFIAHLDEFEGDDDDDEKRFKTEQEKMHEWYQACQTYGMDFDAIDPKPDPEEDETIRIYVCATMWHEDKNEMLQMLKAVMRLDFDQGTRRIAKEFFKEDSESLQYFEMEVNIFFDDAFEQGDTDAEDDRKVNRFVMQLVDTMNDAVNQVLGKNVKIESPTIVPTPYGGKLIWRLPSGNRLIAHVKDKDLIRHRKRWSQCMYMYYLLGYRLAAREDLSETRKRKISNNTFVLALDGDINFQPSAVHMVVDLMKKNSKLGAACGRIHPIGSGPIVWYQKFEYAIGHWLQKATEHVFGCVLCSPGCFSLFRARAVMDKSVMNKYTTKPTEALHYVQYDQGEDRWLCTLMLQRGWRIEYCAASDSYTHAPEGFAEFYTQRRRWAPSTMANIMDLLGEYKQTVNVNENISYLYIGYQAFLMLGTILSPGTIFLMIVSSMNTVMNFQSETSLLINLGPLLIFTFVCLKFEDNDIKINFAMILSLIYALLMLAVLVGTGIDMSQQGLFAPNSLFFLAMMSSFVVAAVLHPQEFACVIPLFIYMLLIPSMYLLLTIYSVTNMHIVSWGTREVKSKLSAKELAQQKADEEAAAREAAAKKAKKGIFGKLDFSQYGSMGKNGLFTCTCCSSTPSDDTMLIKEMSTKMNDVSKVITTMQTKLEQSPFMAGGSRSSVMMYSRQNSLVRGSEDSAVTRASESTVAIGEGGQLNAVNGQQSPEGATEQESKSQDSTAIIKPATDVPKWIAKNNVLRQFPRQNIIEREQLFWREMIDEYLLPLDENREEKKRIQAELEDLRNKVVFAFSFINVIFVLFVFLLQLHKDVFGVDIPISITYNRTYIEDEDRYEIKRVVEATRMDPIGLVLVICFGAILIVQITGMLIHRFGTLAHLLAYTHIFNQSREVDEDQLFNGPAFVRNMLNFEDGGSSEEADGETRPETGAAGVDVVLRQKSTQPMRLVQEFAKKFDKLEADQSNLEKMPSFVRKNTKKALSRRDRRSRRTSMLSDGNSDTINSQMSLGNNNSMVRPKSVMPNNSSVNLRKASSSVSYLPTKKGDEPRNGGENSGAPKYQRSMTMIQEPNSWYDEAVDITNSKPVMASTTDSRTQPLRHHRLNNIPMATITSNTDSDADTGKEDDDNVIEVSRL